MQHKLLLLAVTGLVLAGAPAAFAAHSQLANGSLYSYPFQVSQDTWVGFDWIGVGGEGGEGPLAPYGSNNLGPTPDDCFDADGWPFEDSPWFLQAVVPSVAVLTTVPTQTLVPGQSVPAPQALVDACTLAREVLFGQESDHTYATPQQQVGFGDFNFGVEAVVTSAGFFDNSLVAVPNTLSFQFCSGTFADAQPVGNEDWAFLGFPNGRLVLSGAPTCTDLTNDYLQFLADNPDAQWDAGTFNRVGTANQYHHVVAGNPDGLYVSCANFSVQDANAAAAGFFEDYAFYFIDNVDANVVTDFWQDPIGHSDGGAPGLDCSSLGITL